MNKPCVFRGVPIDGIQAVENGVTLRKVFATYCTSAALLFPLLIFQFATNLGFAAFVISQFFENLSAKCEQ